MPPSCTFKNQHYLKQYALASRFSCVWKLSQHTFSTFLLILHAINCWYLPLLPLGITCLAQLSPAPLLTSPREMLLSSTTTGNFLSEMLHDFSLEKNLWTCTFKTEIVMMRLSNLAPATREVLL
jgi:hypothetical protein